MVPQSQRVRAWMVRWVLAAGITLAIWPATVASGKPLCLWSTQNDDVITIKKGKLKKGKVSALVGFVRGPAAGSGFIVSGTGIASSSGLTYAMNLQVGPVGVSAMGVSTGGSEINGQVGFIESDASLDMGDSSVAGSYGASTAVFTVIDCAAAPAFP